MVWSHLFHLVDINVRFCMQIMYSTNFLQHQVYTRGNCVVFSVQLEFEVSDVESESAASPVPEVSLDFDIPSPRTYLAKLRATLERSKNHSQRHTNIGIDAPSRRRRYSSPLLGEVSKHPVKSKQSGSVVNGCRGESSDNESTLSSSSSTSLSIPDINNTSGVPSAAMKREAQPHKCVHRTPSRKANVNGHVTGWDLNGTNGAATYLSGRSIQTSGAGEVLASRSGNGLDAGGNNDLMASLYAINGQLGELLNRITPQPLNSTPTAASAYPSSRYTPSPSPYPSGNTSLLMPPPQLNTSAL